MHRRDRFQRVTEDEQSPMADGPEPGSKGRRRFFVASTERTQDKVKVIRNGREEAREYVGSHYVVVQMVDTDSVYNEQQKEFQHHQVIDDSADVQNEQVALAVTESLKDLIEQDGGHRKPTLVSHTQRATKQHYSPHTFSSQQYPNAPGGPSSYRFRQNPSEVSQQIHDRANNESKTLTGQQDQHIAEEGSVNLKNDEPISESDNDELDRDMRTDASGSQKKKPINIYSKKSSGQRPDDLEKTSISPYSELSPISGGPTARQNDKSLYEKSMKESQEYAPLKLSDRTPNLSATSGHARTIQRHFANKNPNDQESPAGAAKSQSGIVNYKESPLNNDQYKESPFKDPYKYKNANSFVSEKKTRFEEEPSHRSSQKSPQKSKQRYKASNKSHRDMPDIMDQAAMANEAVKGMPGFDPSMMHRTPTFQSPDLQGGKENNSSVYNSKNDDNADQVQANLALYNQHTFQEEAHSTGKSSGKKSGEATRSRQPKFVQMAQHLNETKQSAATTFVDTQSPSRQALEYSRPGRSPGAQSPYHKSAVGARATDAGLISHEAENERLKTTVLVLNQKLNDQQDSEDQIQLLRRKNRELEEELRDRRGKHSDLESIISSLKTEREVLLKENESLTEEIGEIRDQNGELESKSQQIESENQYLSDELHTSRTEKSELEGIQNKMKSELSKLKIQLNTLSTQKQQLTTDNSSLKSTNTQLKGESTSLRSEIASLANQLQFRDGTIESLKDDIRGLNADCEHHGQARNNLKQDNNSLNDKIIQLEEQLYESKQVQLDMIDQIKQLEGLKQDLEHQNHEQGEKIQDLDEEVARLEDIIKQMQGDIEQLNNNSNGLEKELDEQAKAMDDMEKQKNNAINQVEDKNRKLEGIIDKLKNQINQLNGANDELENQLQQQFKAMDELEQKKKRQIGELEDRINDQEDVIQQQDDKIQELEKQLRTIKGQFAALDGEIDKLQKMIADLEAQKKDLQSKLAGARSKIGELNKTVEKLGSNQQAIYIPKKSDNIDEVLANFINQYPERERMKILFLRESEGVYQFGQKRVYIKIEKGNNLLVRVGGGFMHIGDFIQQYTREEVEKVQRRNPMDRFQSKLQLQKITIESANQYERLAVTSPQRSRSPQRSLSPKSRYLSPSFKKSIAGYPTMKEVRFQSPAKTIRRNWSNQRQSRRMDISLGRDHSPIDEKNKTQVIGEHHCHHKMRRQRGARRSTGLCVQYSQPSQQHSRPIKKTITLTLQKSPRRMLPHLYKESLQNTLN